MGVRGELFSARVRSNNDRRTYFFNVKENRNRDMFLTIVESKKAENGEEFERHQVVIFEDDLHLFTKGFERVMEFVRDQRNVGTITRERPAEDRPERNYDRHREAQGSRDGRPPRDNRGPRNDRGPGDNRGPRERRTPRPPRRPPGASGHDGNRRDR